MLVLLEEFKSWNPTWLFRTKISLKLIIFLYAKIQIYFVIAYFASILFKVLEEFSRSRIGYLLQEDMCQRNSAIWNLSHCSNVLKGRVYLFSADAKVQTAGLSSSWLAIFKCRRGSAVTLLGISKCRRGSADRGWLLLSADAKVQILVLSLSSLDCAHISSSDTFRLWN